MPPKKSKLMKALISRPGATGLFTTKPDVFGDIPDSVLDMNQATPAPNVDDETPRAAALPSSSRYEPDVIDDIPDSVLDMMYYPATRASTTKNKTPRAASTSSRYASAAPIRSTMPAPSFNLSAPSRVITEEHSKEGKKKWKYGHTSLAKEIKEGKGAAKQKAAATRAAKRASAIGGARRGRGRGGRNNPTRQAEGLVQGFEEFAAERSVGNGMSLNEKNAADERAKAGAGRRGYHSSQVEENSPKPSPKGEFGMNPKQMKADEERTKARLGLISLKRQSAEDYLDEGDDLMADFLKPPTNLKISFKKRPKTSTQIESEDVEKQENGKVQDSIPLLDESLGFKNPRTDFDFYVESELPKMIEKYGIDQVAREEMMAKLSKKWAEAPVSERSRCRDLAEEDTEDCKLHNELVAEVMFYNDEGW